MDFNNSFVIWCNVYSHLLSNQIESNKKKYFIYQVGWGEPAPQCLTWNTLRLSRSSWIGRRILLLLNLPTCISRMSTIVRVCQLICMTSRSWLKTRPWCANTYSKPILPILGWSSTLGTTRLETWIRCIFSKSVLPVSHPQLQNDLAPSSTHEYCINIT